MTDYITIKEIPTAEYDGMSAYAVKARNGQLVGYSQNKPFEVKIGFPDGTEAVYPEARSLQDFLNRVWEYDKERKLKVLQKKLDKAMDALNELKDGHVQGSADGIKLWAQVIAETAIKEIEDIKA